MDLVKDAAEKGGGRAKVLDSGLVRYGDHGLWDVVRGGDDVGGAGLGRDALELDTLCEGRQSEREQPQ